MTRLFLDFETRSKIDLRKVGADRYSRHPSTRALMLAYRFGTKGPVSQWIPAEREPMPRDLKEGLEDPDVLKQAWNAAFEMAIFRNVLKMKIYPDEWRCTMVMALTLSLPGKLEKAGPIVGLDSDKQKDSKGKALMRFFSSPNKRTRNRPWEWNTHITAPQKWDEYLYYNRQDIVAEGAIYDRIKRWDLPEDEWDLWALDQIINQRGLPINLDMVDNACDVVEHAREVRIKEMREITGLDNPRSGPQLLAWLRERDYVFDDLKAGHIKRALEKAKEDPSSEDDYVRVLQLRSEVAKTSLDKFFALERATADDGNLRGTLQFAAAGRTWRWGGRIYQPQNLARPHPALEEPEKLTPVVEDLSHMTAEEFEEKYKTVGKDGTAMDALSSCVRPVVQAPPGFLLVGADLNAIENRVLGWLANDQKILGVFKRKQDPYIDFARYMYETDYDTEWTLYKPKDGSKGDKSHRTTAKPGVLGCGYMLGAGKQFENRDTGEIEATGLLGYAWNMGVKSFTPEQAELSVRVWRDTFEDAVDYWYEIEDAMKKCIRDGRPTEAGHVRFVMDDPFLRMVLPSGRSLHYLAPRLEERLMPWGKMKKVIIYEGLDDKNRWGDIQTHPGKITENADQAISRDLLAHGIKLAEREGLKVRLHVHDEIQTLSPEKRAKDDLKLLIECMTVVPKWAPGLPLGAAGTVSRYFFKD